jgi:vancomycin resistance protein YoaR
MPPRRFNLRRYVVYALAFLVIFALSLITFHQWFFSERIALGVSIHGHDLGALRQEQAHLRLTQSLSAYVDGKIALQTDSRTWHITPRELGLEYDVDAMVAEAYSVGRDVNLFEQLLVQMDTMIHGKDIPLRFSVDEQSQRGIFDFISSSTDQPAVDAGLVLDGEEIKVTSSSVGFGLLRDATADLLSSRFAETSLEQIILPLGELPPSLTEADAEPVKTRAETMISEPLTLRYEDRVWTGSDGSSPVLVAHSWQLEPISLTAMLRFSIREESGKKEFIAHFDPAMARKYGRHLASEINREPTDARLTWKNGKLTHLIPSQEGLELNVEALPDALNEAAASDVERVISLPITFTEPKISLADMPGMGIVEKLGEWSTVYGDSYWERRQNVELAASRIDGTIVPPGETFSFNEAVGEITSETGYAIGLSIVGDQTVPDAGGGVCQVSTTVFQAAFWAGYPIIERHPHSYRLSRYEPPAGLDATVYAPSTDFKFKNSTDTHLLIQTRTDGWRLYVAFFGTKPSWKVEVDGPYLSNWILADTTVIKEYSTAIATGRQIWVEVAGAGVDVTISRTVTQDGEELENDSFFSRYRPQRNVLLIGGEPPQDEDDNSGQ